MTQFFNRLGFIALLLFGGGGCVESPASWMPDSSGFVFVRTEASGAQTVHHYDLAKKAERLVVAVDAPIVSDLAVNSKGDAFALVTHTKEKGHVLSLVDFTGKSLHRSDPLKLDDASSVSLQWSPKEDRLWLGLEHRHGWYDWRKGTLTLKDGGTPWPVMLGSPLRPDGSGYMIQRQRSGMAFVDKEGWERRLIEDLDLGISARKTHRLPRFEWKDGTLSIRAHGSALLDFDTDKGAAVRKEYDPKITKAFPLNPATGPALIDLILFAGDETGLAILQKEGKKDAYQVVAHNFQDNKNKTLVTESEHAILLPAPDRKHILVFLKKNDGRRTLLIVDGKGEVVDEVSLGKSLDRSSSSLHLNRIIRAQADDEGPTLVPPPLAPKVVKTAPTYYEVALDTLLVRPTKASGRNWDNFRGYPDLEVQVRNLRSGTTFTSPVAEDVLEHTYDVLTGKVAVGDVLEIDVWDKDVTYHDHVGLKRLELTQDLLERDAVELSFGQVSSLKLRFFPVRSSTMLKVSPKGDEVAFEDGRVATLFEQLAPSTIELDRAVRSRDKDRAIVLIHGLRAQFFYDSMAHRPYFDSWQEPRGMLVSALVDSGDVYGFSYGQNRDLDQVSGHPKLREGVKHLKRMGYKEVALVGHSAGGIIARQFVEDYPEEGVTQVVQACTPNGGAGLAHCSFIVGAKQSLFLESLLPQTRSVHSARRDAPIGRRIAFTCLVGTYGKCGDGALSCYSQWPADLQAQGIPAYAVRVDHHTGMDSHCLVRKIAEVIAAPPRERWSAEEVEAARRVFFD